MQVVFLMEAEAMQMTINIGYDQVFELVQQLPPGERKRLFTESMLPATIPVSREPIATTKKMSDEEYYKFLMNFPVATEEEIEEYNEFRRRFRCRAT